MKLKRPSLFAALWLPRFQLQAALRSAAFSCRLPVAVLDGSMEGLGAEAEVKGRLLHASEAAERSGVSVGMSPAQAQARCAQIAILHRLPQEEEAAQQDLLRCAADWTPDYEAMLAGLCVLDLSRIRGLDKPRALEQAAQQMCQRLAKLKLEARVGVAIDPDMACLAANVAKPVLVIEAGDTQSENLLKELPVEVLQPSAALTEVLQLWGISKVGQLAALPRADVAARLGMEGVLLRDVAAGGRERLLKLVRPSLEYREEMEIEHPIETLEPLLYLLRRMLTKLCARLAETWLVASAQSLTLQFANKTSHHRVLNVAEPTRSEELLLRVLHTHLEGLSAAAPVIGMSLELAPAEPAFQQTSLFARGLRDPHRFVETLAHLEALLGAGKAGKARMLASRRGDAFQVVNFLHASNAEPQMVMSEDSVHGPPLCRFRPPKPVEVELRDGRPVSFETREGRVAITEASDVCVLSGDWWDRHAWERKVWDITLADGSVCELAQDQGRWVLNGIFG